MDYVTIFGNLISNDNVILEESVTETVTKRSCLSSISKQIKDKKIKVTKKPNEKMVQVDISEKDSSTNNHDTNKKIAIVDDKILEEISVNRKNSDLVKEAAMDDVFTISNKTNTVEQDQEEFIESYRDSQNNTLKSLIQLSKDSAKKIDDAKNNVIDVASKEHSKGLKGFRRVIRGIFDGK